MKNAKKILVLLLLTGAGMSAFADGKKLPTEKSNVRREILRHIQIPGWMTRSMKLERVSLVFVMGENGKPELRRLSCGNEKLAEHVRETFSKMELDTTVMLNDTEYLMTLEFDVR